MTGWWLTDEPLGVRVRYLLLRLLTSRNPRPSKDVAG